MCVCVHCSSTSSSRSTSCCCSLDSIPPLQFLWLTGSWFSWQSSNQEAGNRLIQRCYSEKTKLTPRKTGKMRILVAPPEFHRHMCIRLSAREPLPLWFWVVRSLLLFQKTGQFHHDTDGRADTQGVEWHPDFERLREHWANDDYCEINGIETV